MKLLVVGSDKIFAIENFYVKYLRELGIEILHFSAHSMFYDYYNKNILNKLLFKIGLSRIYKVINNRFISDLNIFKPNIIWVFKGMEIYPESLEYARSKLIKLVNYNPDNPFIFSGSGSGNANVTKSINLYDLHLTYNSAVKMKLEVLYNVPVNMLPFGFEVSNELYKICIKQEEIVKACFLGNPDLFRADFLLKIAESGIKLDVYGNDWHKYLKHPNIMIFEPVYGDELWKVLRKYRVQINMMRPHNLDSHNMRSFEVPGVGGILLAPETWDHKIYFEVDKEIFLYKDLMECITQIKKLLALDLNEINTIRERTRSRSVNSAYSYKDRAKQVLEKIKSACE